MKKRIIVLLLTLTVLLAAFTLTASAAEIIDSGTCGENLTWVLDNEGTLTISGTGDMDDYMSNTSVPWYDNRSAINSVVMEGGVTSIASCAFVDCSNLTVVEIPESVNNIGNLSFFYCSSLTEIHVDENNPSYSSDEYGVLFNTEKATLLQAPGAISDEYQLPEGITTIGEGAFFCCSSLTSISIPESITSIGGSAFRGCTSLANVYFDGSEEQWTTISIGGHNEDLTTATIHFNSTLPDSSVTPPVDVPVTPPIEDDKPLTPPGESDKPFENPFTDVPTEQYYHAPVLWAVENGITTGMTETTFAPDATCTRAQIVTFLWRANGSPAPASSSNPFTDVPAGQWYTDAVLWAVENGITSGTSATTFSPDAGCTRGQVATFLWRAKGQPSPGGENIFSDLISGAYYYDAVLWAVENGITNGMGDGTFAPDATCTRGQIVTFLYRAMA